MEIFRELRDKEKEEFIKWARDNYDPFTPINKLWHPIIQAECVRINDEQHVLNMAGKDEQARMLNRVHDELVYLRDYEGICQGNQRYDYLLDYKRELNLKIARQS